MQSSRHVVLSLSYLTYHEKSFLGKKKLRGTVGAPPRLSQYSTL